VPIGSVIIAKVKDISLKMTPLEKSGTLSKNNKKKAPRKDSFRLRRNVIESWVDSISG
jgi:hypothetical protein